MWWLIFFSEIKYQVQNLRSHISLFDVQHRKKDQMTGGAQEKQTNVETGC